MRTVLCAAVVLGLAAPAFAQVNILAPNIKYTTQEDYDKAQQQERDYDATMKKLPNQGATKNDPWGSVRSTGPAQTDQKTKKKQAGAN